MKKTHHSPSYVNIMCFQFQEFIDNYTYFVSSPFCWFLQFMVGLSEKKVNILVQIWMKDSRTVPLDLGRDCALFVFLVPFFYGLVTYYLAVMLFSLK